MNLGLDWECFYCYFATLVTWEFHINDKSIACFLLCDNLLRFDFHLHGPSLGVHDLFAFGTITLGRALFFTCRSEFRNQENLTYPKCPCQYN